jgi:hypothetical protein
MIIEPFAPPRVGKTTFARTLTARLRERRHLTEPKLSSRPIEKPPLQRGIEQIFASNFEENIEIVRIIDRLDGLLRKYHRPAIRVSSHDQQSLPQGIERDEEDFINKLRTGEHGSA